MKVNILCFNVIWELARLIPNALTFLHVFIWNAGSQAYEKLCSVLNNINLVKGITQASPFSQTSCLEGFHFAPKMIAFSYVGMYCRYNHAFFSKSIIDFTVDLDIVEIIISLCIAHFLLSYTNLR